jgi:hypothetical protein
VYKRETKTELKLTAQNLLRQDGSLFRNLCEKSGKYRELHRAAERKEKEDQARERESGGGGGGGA